MGVDFITDLRETDEGFDTILTVVDSLTKFVYLIPAMKTDTAEDSAWRLFERVFCVHGMPRRLQSDRDPRWCASWFAALMRHFNVVQRMGTSYQHTFNGAVEVMNRHVEICLRSVLAHFEDRDFTDYLPLVQFAINSSVHTGLKQTPHFTVFGTEPSNPALFGTFQDGRTDPPEGIEDFVQFQEEVITATRDCLNDAQERSLMLENDKARDVVFSVGEWVLLGTNNLAQHYFQRQERKFRPAFIGPFRVTERVSEYTYRLDLPQN